MEGARQKRFNAFNSKIRFFGVFTIFVFVFIVTGIFAPVSIEEDKANATGQNSDPTLSITPSNSANLTLMPGVFNSVSQTIEASTTSSAGYTLTFVASGNSSELIDSGNTNQTIPSILSASTSNDFNNNYGWKKNSEVNYQPVPVFNPEELAVTSAANVTADTYTLTFGALVDDSYDSGPYVKEFVVAAIANPADYVITYHSNTNDTVTGMPTPNPTILSNQFFATTIPSDAPVRNGYTFLGWDEDNDAITATYAPGDMLPLDASVKTDIDLYAIWEQDTCSAGHICYYGNGADAGSMDDQEVTSNTDVYLISPNYARSGYGFAGWNTATDGSGTNYGVSTDYHVGDVSTSGIIMYAKWIQPVGYFQTWNGCSSMSTNEVIALSDARDNMTYAVAKLADGGCWMTENLRLDFRNATITALNTNSPTAGFITESASATPSNPFCLNNNSACLDQIQYNVNNMDWEVTRAYNDYSQTSGWYSYGGYYNWYTATAGNGLYSKESGSTVGDICPAGWHLPTGNGGEWSAFNTAVNAGRANKDVGLRTYPVNFVWSGDISTDLGHGLWGRYWSSTATSKNNAGRMGNAATQATPAKNYNKYSGFAVRCKYEGSNYTVKSVDVTLGQGVKSVSFTSVDFGTEVATIDGTTVNLVENAQYTMTATLDIGYGFTGWTGSAEATIGSLSANPTSISINDDSTVSVTATLIPTYTLTVSMDENVSSIGIYNANYGIRQVTESGARVTLASGVEYMITPSFDTDYTFNTWTVTSNGTLNDATSAATALTITGNAALVLTSKEIVPETYTLTYNIGSGATDGPASDSGIGMDGNYTFTISNTIPHRPGYSFLGWTRTENSSTVEFTGGDTYIVTSTTAILYAVWQEDTCAAGYICYFGNNETSGTMSDQSANSNTDVTLIPSNYAKIGYGFAGWNTMADGTGTNLGPNARYHTGDLSNEGQKLYAMWIQSAGNFQTWNSCANLNSHEVTALTDVRDSNTYAIAKLDDDNCWMIENLRLDPSTANITMLNTHYPNQDFPTLASQSSSSNTLCNTTGSACTDQLQYNTNNLNRNLTQSHNTSGNDVAWYSYGVYYNWYTATAGTGTTSVSSGDATGDICPTGWHLPTGNGGEWTDLNTYENSNSAVTDFGLRAYPVNLIWSGDYNNTQKTGAYSYNRYWSSTAADADTAYRMGTGSNVVLDATYSKWDAFAVRCIYDGDIGIPHQVTVTLPQNVTSVSFQNEHYGTQIATTANPTVTLMENVNYTVTANIALGYIFDAWAVGSDGTLSSDSTNPTTISVVDDTTLTLSVNQMETYTVTVAFDEGGSSVGFYNVTYGVAQATPNNNTVTLYSGIEYIITASFQLNSSFDSWSTTANGTLGSTATNPTTYTVSGTATLTLTSGAKLPPATCNTPVPNITYMQDINGSNYNTVINSLTTEQAYYIRDSRDYEPYCVSKLADGNLWMIDNLRLDLNDSTILSAVNASNTNATAAEINYLKHGGGTSTDRYPTDALNSIPWETQTDYSFSVPMTASSGTCKNSDAPCPNDPETREWNKDSIISNNGNGSGKIGVFYNFCAASAGTSCWGNGKTFPSKEDPYPSSLYDIDGDICPSSWHIPTSKEGGEYYGLYELYNSDPAEFNNIFSTTPSDIFFNGHIFNNTYRSAKYWSSTQEDTEGRMRTFGTGTANNQPVIHLTGFQQRHSGLPVRCMLTIPSYTTTVSFSSQEVTSVSFTNATLGTQTITTSGDSVSLKHGESYTITTAFEYGYELASYAATGGTLGSTTTNPTTYSTIADSTITITGQQAATRTVTVNLDAHTASVSIANGNNSTIIITNSNNNNDGTHTGTATLYQRTEYTITSSPRDPYTHDTWSTTANGTLGSASANPTTYVVTGDATLSAISRPPSPPETCNTPVPNVTYMQDINGSNYTTVMNSLTAEAPYYLRDARDGEPYCVSKLADGNLWMLDNLRLNLNEASIINNITTETTNATATAIYHFKNGGGTANDKYATNAVNTLAWGSQTQDLEKNTPMSINSGDCRDTTKCVNDPEDGKWTKDSVTTNYGAGSGKIGIYYNYCAATAGSYCWNVDTNPWVDETTSLYDIEGDICPTSWHLPTSGTGGEYYALHNTYYNAENARIKLSATLSGQYHKGTDGSLIESQHGRFGMYWSSTLNPNLQSVRTFYVAQDQIKSSIYYAPSQGLTVRCMLSTPSNLVTVNFANNVGIADVSFTSTDLTTQTVTSSGEKVALKNGATYTITTRFNNGYGFVSYATTANGSLGSISVNPTTYTTSGPSTITVTGQQLSTYTATINLDANTKTVTISNAAYGSTTITNSNNNGNNTHTETVTLSGGVPYTISSTHNIGSELGTWTTTANGSIGSATSNPTTFTITGTASLSTTSQLLAPPATCNTPVPNITYMQDINTANYHTVMDSLTAEAAYYLRDSRDNEPYCVSKLADGNLWMLDNLRLDISNSEVLNNVTAQNTNASSTAIGYLKNGGGTSTDQYAVNGVNTYVWGNHLSGTDSNTPMAVSSGGCGNTTNCANDPTSGEWNKDSVVTNYGNGSGKIGVYYNFCAATAGTYCWNTESNPWTDANAQDPYDIEADICPVGWHMPSNGGGGELYNLYNSIYSASDTMDKLSIALSGWYYKSNNANGTISDTLQESNGILWSSTMNNQLLSNRTFNATSSEITMAYYGAASGIAMRCVRAEIKQRTHVVFAGEGVSDVNFEAQDGDTVNMNESGYANLEIGKEYAVVANFDAGYRFVSWATDAGGTLGSTSTNPTTYTVSDDATLTITGVEIPKYTTTVNFAGTGVTNVAFYAIGYGTQNVTTSGGTVTLRQGVEYRVTTTLTNSDYRVASYVTTQNGTLGSAMANPTSYVVTGDTTLTVTGEIIPTYTVTVELDAHTTSVIISDDTYGSTTITNTDNNGDGTHTAFLTLYDRVNYYLVGTFSSGYELDSWITDSDGNVGSSTLPSTTFYVTDSTTLYATSRTFSCNTPVPNITYMQEITSNNYNTVLGSLVTEQPYYLLDSRDNELYCVSKLADGKLWMIDNLRLDLQNTTVLNNVTAQNTNASATALNYLKNGGGTKYDKYATNKVNNAVWSNYNQNYYSIPMTVSSGTCNDKSNCANSPTPGEWTKDSVVTHFGNGSGKVGVYYNFCAASAGSYCWGDGTRPLFSSTGADPGNPLSDPKPTSNYDIDDDICPSGWHMPTGESGSEYEDLYNAYPNRNPSSTSSLQYNFGVTLSGNFNGGKSDLFMWRDYYSGVWTSTWVSSGSVRGINFTIDSIDMHGSRSNSSGYALRCIASTPYHAVEVTMSSNVEEVTFTNSNYSADVQTITTSGDSVSLKQNNTYNVSVTFASGYELDSLSTTVNGTLGSTTTVPTTYSVSGTATLSVTDKAETP